MGPSPATRASDAAAEPSPSSGTAQTRWRTPSSSTTSATGVPEATAARMVAASPSASWNSPTTGEVLRARARGVEPRRAEEPVAILLGPRQRPLVGQHAALGTERLDPQPREEPALDAL